MIFLIEYDRRLGKLIRLREFTDSARDEAAKARLDCELVLHRQGLEREVVLLEAVDRAALEQTHRRYFQTLTQTLDEFARSTSGD